MRHAQARRPPRHRTNAIQHSWDREDPPRTGRGARQKTKAGNPRGDFTKSRTPPDKHQGALTSTLAPTAPNRPRAAKIHTAATPSPTSPRTHPTQAYRRPNSPTAATPGNPHRKKRRRGDLSKTARRNPKLPGGPGDPNHPHGKHRKANAPRPNALPGGETRPGTVRDGRRDRRPTQRMGGRS